MEKCWPLELTKMLTNKYPDCWDTIEVFRESRKTGEIPWGDRCYVPIGGTQAIVKEHGNEIFMIDLNSQDYKESITDATLMAAIAPWRRYKQIYTFKPELEYALREQAYDCEIPVEIFDSLPYPGIYIQTTTFEDEDGFFVHLEYDMNRNEYELRLTIIQNDGQISAPSVHLKENGTIMDGLNEYVRIMKLNNCGLVPEIDTVDADMLYDDIAGRIQLVLYLCAQNKEVKPDPVQEKIVRTPKDPSMIKDKYREIKKYICGEEISETLKVYRRKINTTGESKKSSGIYTPSCSIASSSKRPHMRRAHWHHYRTGAGRANLILKWLPPMMIHEGEMVEDNSVQVNEID